MNLILFPGCSVYGYCIVHVTISGLWICPNNFSLTRLTPAMTGWFPTLSRPPFDRMGAETRGYWYSFPFWFYGVLFFALCLNSQVRQIVSIDIRDSQVRLVAGEQVLDGTVFTCRSRLLVGTQTDARAIHGCGVASLWHTRPTVKTH